MHYDWITDVLTDLRAFARTNGFDRLARHLDDTLEIAAAEIARAEAARPPATERAMRATTRPAVGKGS